MPEFPFWAHNWCLPPPGSHSPQTADFLSLLSATGSTGRVEQSSKQMRYYLLVPVPAAHNSGWTDCSNYDAFFIHSNESITCFTREGEVTKQNKSLKKKSNPNTCLWGKTRRDSLFFKANTYTKLSYIINSSWLKTILQTNVYLLK